MLSGGFHQNAQMLVWHERCINKCIWTFAEHFNGLLYRSPMSKNDWDIGVSLANLFVHSCFAILSFARMEHHEDFALLRDVKDTF